MHLRNLSLHSPLLAGRAAHSYTEYVSVFVVTISVQYNRYNTHKPQSEELQADQCLLEQESSPALL